MRLLLLFSVVAYYATSFNAEIADSDFDSTFFKTVANYVSGNMVCSSLSVDIVLSLMELGAKGSTNWQLRLLLQTNDTRHAVRVHDFLSKVDNFKKVGLQMANNIFLADHYILNENFNMTEFHITRTASINFGNSTAASKIINDWCAAHTNNRITDVISSVSLDAATSIVLVNALYFKGIWLYPFNVNNTKLRAFTVDGTSKDVPTMHINNQLRYGKLPEINASYVEVPYGSDDTSHEISMYVILPDEVSGFEQLEKNLNKVTVNQLIQNASDYTVDLFLPKFKVEFSMLLDDPLFEMGLMYMFSKDANFSGIVENGTPNHVRFVQKCFIEVTETGTEAANATSASSHMRFGVDEASLNRITFDVNRPFVSIVALKSGAALLSAIIADPQTE